MPLSENNLPTQATLTVVFYFGPGDSPPYRLDKRYLVKNWTDEAHLRHLLDEIAAEMNHLSGYGIWSMAVKNDDLNFTVDYKERCKLYDPEKRHLYYNDFQYLLRFEIGHYAGRRGGATRVEIPRLNILTPYNQPTPNYELGDKLFQLRAMSSYSGKKRRSAGTAYSLLFDADNPFLVAFIKKICKDEVLAPNTTRAWQPYSEHFSLSWWPLPKAQQSWPKRQKLKKEEQKREKAEERQRQQQEKAGIVYKDKKQSQKADQVYLIQMGEDDVYKIGISNAPGKRLRSLNTSSPFDLRLVHQFVADPAEEAEAQLHRRFATHQMSGEWFRLTSEQVADIRRITSFEAGQFMTEKD